MPRVFQTHPHAHTSALYKCTLLSSSTHPPPHSHPPRCPAIAGVRPSDNCLPSLILMCLLTAAFFHGLSTLSLIAINHQAKQMLGTNAEKQGGGKEGGRGEEEEVHG